MTAQSNSANGAMLSAHATELETATGVFVDVADPMSGTLILSDIAQGLALTCRYGGQIKRFYSVAEHSVLVHDLLEHQGAPARILLAGLFHDAAEAYLGDVVAPLKYALRQLERARATAHWRDASHFDRDVVGVYDAITADMDDAIAERFGVEAQLFDDTRIRAADMWALRIEAAELTHTGGKHWRWPGELPNDGLLPAGVPWHGGVEWQFARAKWLDRCGRYGLYEARR